MKPKHRINRYTQLVLHESLNESMCQDPSISGGGSFLLVLVSLVLNFIGIGGMYWTDSLYDCPLPRAFYWYCCWILLVLVLHFIGCKTDSPYDCPLPRAFYPSSSRIHLSSVLLDKAKNGIDGNIYWGWDKCDVYWCNPARQSILQLKREGKTLMGILN